MLETRKQIDLSVIIPTKDREQDLLECLDSLFKQKFFPREIIIVDQSTIKISPEKLQSIIPSSVESTYIYDPNISGATQARNIALGQAKGEKVLLLDDDIILLDNSLDNLLSIFDKDIGGEIAGVGGSATNEAPSLLQLVGVKLFCHGPFSFWNNQITFDHKAKNSSNVLMRSSIIPAGASCVKTEVFKNFRFDENLVGYTHGDDSIFGYQASSKYKFFLYSGFRFYHKKRSQATKDKGKNIERQIVWWFYFFNKYVKKTAFNTLCYAWSFFGIFLKVVISFYDLKVLRGAFRGWRRILFLIVKKVPVDQYIKVTSL
ncbi:glycosyltransferase family 2 protein [Candidatus Omnitrophota bacterium]